MKEVACFSLSSKNKRREQNRASDSVEHTTLSNATVREITLSSTE